MKLLYYSPSSYGGLADYAHEQANALAEIGVDVHFLCTPEYPAHKASKYRRMAELEEVNLDTTAAHKIARARQYLRVTLNNYRSLANTIRRGSYQYVLLSAYAEYFAPLWAGQFRRLAKQGVTFGAVVHDPVRDFVLGPIWWHKWSVAQGYSFLRNVFVHEQVAIDYGTRADCIRTTVISHGVYNFLDAQRSRLSVRKALNVPEQAKVMLSFGHIRDGKNLDLIIRAMVELPDVYLVVAGKEQSSGQRAAEYYQALAERLNVAERCRWQIGFISKSLAADLLSASDVVALTYSRDFRSASGVLTVAANYQKQCIASGGEGSLKTLVTKYHLGTWVEPDSWEAIQEGIKQHFLHPPSSLWREFYAENSWLANAQQVAKFLEAS